MAQRSEIRKVSKRISPNTRAGRYAFALAIVVCLAVGTYLTVEDRTSSLATKLSGLGINLIAAAVFSTIFALLVERENRSVVEDQLNDRFATHTSEILAAISKLNTYLPTEVHPSARAYDPIFNRNLMNDLNHSSYYYFRGPSAKYIAARLKALRRRPDLVRVYIPGPESSASIKFDIANRSRTNRASPDVPALYQRFKDDLFTAMIALFDCRAYGRIEVLFCDDALVARYEVTEQHLYVSWYTSFENDSDCPFPETTEFPRSSLHYQTAMVEMERRASFASSSLLISPDLHMAGFKAQLASIFGPTYDYDRITDITQEYWNNRSSFLAFLDSL